MQEFNASNATLDDSNSSSFAASEADHIKHTNIVFAVLFTLAVMFIFTGNLLVMLAIRVTQGLHTATKIFIMNLAATDITLGLVGGIHRILYELRPELIDVKWICLVKNAIGIGCYFTSALTLFGK